MDYRACYDIRDGTAANREGGGKRTKNLDDVIEMIPQSDIPTCWFAVTNMCIAYVNDPGEEDE